MSRADEEAARQAYEERYPGAIPELPRHQHAVDINGRVYRWRPAAGGWSFTGQINSTAAERLHTGFQPVYQERAVTGEPLYADPGTDPLVDRTIRSIPDLQPRMPPKTQGCGCAWFLIIAVIAAIVAIVVIIHVNTKSDVPGNITATSIDDYTIQVSWTETSKNVTGFNIDNGCPDGACGGHGATLAASIGDATSATFTVTPGTYQCFRVQAILKSGVSGWSGYGCASTSGFVMDGTQGWIRTDVILKAGDQLHIKANGQILFGTSNSADPSGDPSCISASNFPAPHLKCLSLIARIGNGHPLEVGTSAVISGQGRLYLAVNASAKFSGSSGAWIVNTKMGIDPPSP